MPTCQYKYQSDYPLIKFACNEPAITNSKFCIFHDKDHYAEHEQEATKGFEEKVRESISQNKPLECIGYYLPAIHFARLLEGKSSVQPVYFTDATFYKEANFGGATFSEEAKFSRAKFSKTSNFGEAKFYKEADFSVATFSEGADFVVATFYKEANFGGATFSKQANFWRATFYKEANFSVATFTEKANFDGATFSEGAKFWRATFSKTPSFAGATFSKTDKDYKIASFQSAKFSEGVDFQRATISEGLDFSVATISKRADFLGATISRANFLGATFYKEANFQSAKFSERADFSGATFSEGADFRNSKFSKVADFRNSKFSKVADFRNSKFWGRAGFFYTKFLAEVYFLDNEFTGRTFFRYTSFEQPKKVTFDNNNLENVSFADSDITRIRFGDKITWRGGKNGFMIIEEVWLKNKAKGEEMRSEDEDVSLELVLSVYRNLRENYEFRLRYDDAGKFFIKEMELRRKYKEIEIETEDGTKTQENDWFGRHFSLTGLYYHLSRYGESISRPTLIGIITVLLSTLFWVMQSNPSLEPHTSTYVGLTQFTNSTQWIKAFERSFADFLPLLSLGGDIKVGIIDYIIKIVGGALTFGLLAIALRRKFERKYTR